MSKQKDKSAGPGASGRTARIANRRARHEYHILEVVECGMALVGTEVKSLRAGQAKIDEAYARIRGGQAFLVGVNIATYPMAAAAMQHDPTRDRRLLLHRRQIDQLQAHALQKGNTLVPLAVYFKDGWAKCEIGKRQFDKRQDIKKRDQQRDIAREMSRRKRER
jgi:SsrA-binding protein